jgi:hypothetical protein
MAKCLLCKDKDADKKGSHIVPHFLLKRIENVEGKSGRDYELGFYIEEFDTQSYFGRSVQKEKLDEIYGELSDEEIEKNKHPLIVDNFFCSDCEKRLSVIESEYAKTLKKTGEDNFESGVPSEIGLLFWMSVIWRMSVNKKSGVQLTKGENEILRRILNRSLAETIDKIDIKKMQESKDLKKISYKLIRCPEYSNEFPTFLLFHPEFRKPYSILVDEYLLLFSFKSNFDNYKSKSFFGFKDEIKSASINKVNTNETIKTISQETLKNINDGIVEKMKTIRVTNIDEFLNKVHIAMGGEGTFMPEEVRSEIMQELTSTEKALGRKYNIRDLRDSTYKIMKKYAPQQ